MHDSILTYLLDRPPRSSSESNTDRTTKSETRKRTAEHEEASRPMKRSRPLEPNGTPAAKPLGVLRQSSPTKTSPFEERRKEATPGTKGPEAKRLKPPEETSGSSKPRIQKAGLSPSPQPDIRVNGSRVSLDERKTKSSVPPLLSPLRLSLDGEPEDEDLRKKPRKKAGEATDDAHQKHHSRTKSEGSRQERKAPFRIPPLLSPTLPAIVEAELALLRTPQKDDASPEHGPSGPQSSGGRNSATKARPEETVNKAAKPSLIVVLKYKKKNASRVKMLLDLPPKGRDRARRDALKERSASLEVTPPPSATKRPAHVAAAAAAASASGSSGLAKRDAASSSWTRPVRPSTPLRHSATAMSRVASSSSQAHTPGETAVHTPEVSDARAASASQGHEVQASSASLLQRGMDFTQLGTKIKHLRDGIVRATGVPNGTTAQPLSSADESKVMVLSIEMILAYMIAFSSMSRARLLDNKAPKYDIWETLLPHFNEIAHRSRHCPPLKRLALQLQCITMEELYQCYLAYPPEQSAPRMFKHLKKRRELWIETQDRERYGSLARDLKDDGLGPWTSVDEASRKSLHILRKWAEREDVEWRAQVSV
jgi:hypothetical protein